MVEKEFEGEKEILVDSPFPHMVDPAWYREAEELFVKRDDGGFWLGFVPHENIAVQHKIGIGELFVDGKRVDSEQFLDTMRRFEPVTEELDGAVIMAEDPGETADIDIPFEEWVMFRCVEVERIVTNRDETVIKEVHLERYYEEFELWETPTYCPFK